MTKPVTYLVINPETKSVVMEACESFADALSRAGLPKGEVDFGAIASEYSIVVYEHGFFVKPEEQHFFALGPGLYAGNALVFRECDGEAADIDERFFDLFRHDIRFFDSSKDVEAAIEAEEIVQPSLKVGSEVVWVWPQPMPEGFAKD